jgi:hypothetical protein
VGLAVGVGVVEGSGVDVGTSVGMSEGVNVAVGLTVGVESAATPVGADAPGANEYGPIAVPQSLGSLLEAAYSAASQTTDGLAGSTAALE